MYLDEGNANLVLRDENIFYLNAIMFSSFFSLYYKEEK